MNTCSANRSSAAYDLSALAVECASAVIFDRPDLLPGKLLPDYTSVPKESFAYAGPPTEFVDVRGADAMNKVKERRQAYGTNTDRQRVQAKAQDGELPVLRGTLFKRKGKLAFYQPIEVALYARCPPTSHAGPHSQRLSRFPVHATQ